MSHYYKQDGSTLYTIVGKNGKERAPYVKEAKELGAAPGVTTITGQLANGGLNQWFVNNAIATCASTPFCEMGDSLESWTKRIKDKLKQENERITGQGHDIHDALEQYYKTGQISNKETKAVKQWVVVDIIDDKPILKPVYYTLSEFIIPVIDLIQKTWPDLQRTDWIAERSFNYKGYYGGRVDISTEAEGEIILDFKTKDSDDVTKYKAYEGHKQQLVAYAAGLQMPAAKLGNIFLSALTPNIVKLEMHEDISELHRCWEKYILLLSYWHIENYHQFIEV